MREFYERRGYSKRVDQICMMGVVGHLSQVLLISTGCTEGQEICHCPEGRRNDIILSQFQTQYLEMYTTKFVTGSSDFLKYLENRYLLTQTCLFFFY